MNYQWYPGHMTKARRMMQEDMKLIDLVIELTDARVPAGRNPDIDELGKNKARLILLNKKRPGRPGSDETLDGLFSEEWMHGGSGGFQKRKRHESHSECHFRSLQGKNRA